MRKFNPTAQHKERAVQAWLILIGAAMQRQTLTYVKFSEMMYGKRAQGVMNKILGHVAYYCIENKLPPLTSIVVGGKRGKPGFGIPIDFAKLDKERERVYTTNWYGIYPPNEDELDKSYKRQQKTLAKH